MSFLGDLGSLYMLILIALLIFGLGMLSKGFFDYIFINDLKSPAKSKGNNKLQSKNWFKISFYSLVGIIISMIIILFNQY